MERERGGKRSQGVSWWLSIEGGGEKVRKNGVRELNRKRRGAGRIQAILVGGRLRPRKLGGGENPRRPKNRGESESRRGSADRGRDREAVTARKMKVEGDRSGIRREERTRKVD